MSKAFDLTTALSHLAAAAPLEFDNFSGAVAAYYAELTTALVNSAPEDLVRLQGRAQTTAHLLEMIDKAKPGAKPQGSTK